MSDEYSFGIIAKNRRRELGLTQDELARRVGCAPITVRKIEADDLRPSVQIAERLAMALNIPLEERSAFVRLARTERPILEEPSVTPMPAPEEIGSEDLSGRAIRGYALGERLGNGGMGVVYRAVQPLVEREVAIKIIMPMYANHPDFIRRFEAEAQLVARLEHPHIVPLYDYWREPSVAYLIMRLLRGGSVQSLLRGGTVLSSETVLRMMEQIGSALSSSHRAGVVHRDLKPANVLLDEDNNAYLADFGIAKNLSSPSSETQTNVVIGSLDYISPEQIRSEFVRPQTDIYALGVMLYELLTGKLPFRGNTPFDVMSQHLNTPLPMLAEHRMGLPRSLDDVIERATAKDPLERYENVELMLNDLRNALGAAPIEIKSKASSLQETIPPLTELDNPYKGLRAFVEGDAQDFYGRETLIQNLLVKLGDAGELSRFLAVVGPSGSGKSSVVKAGLIPALRLGALPGSENWFIVEMMPGAHPLEELEAALLRVAVNPPSSLMEQFHKDSRGLIRAVRRSLPNDPSIDLVLVIDQFEEVFTLVQDEAERMRFLGLLVTAIMDGSSRIRVILTLRADFIDRPLGYVDFGELLRQRMEIILPLTPDELESAIASPAERVGLHLESGLVAAILRDLGDQPGTLPLLQYALTELYEKRAGNTLTKSAYHEIGGVLGALGRRAEEVFKGLDQDGQVIAKQLFLRLVTLGEGVEDTRRRALISELENLKLSDVDLRKFSKAFKATLDAFGNARLLSFDRDPGTRGPTVEVAHEAIIREWGRLRDWLEESRVLVRMQRQLSTAASEWLDAKRDPSFLLSGTKLAQYEGWTENSAIALTQHELDYLKASLSARDQREVEEAERLQRELETAQKLAETESSRAELQTRSAKQLRQRAVFLSGALVLAMVAAIIAGAIGNRNSKLAVQNEAIASTAQAAEALAIQERDRAENENKLSVSRELAAAAVSNLDINPERSILLALQAESTIHTFESEAALRQGLVVSRVRLAVNTENENVQAIAFSPDGTQFATAGYYGGYVQIWDAKTGQEVQKLDSVSELTSITSLIYSLDGKSLIAGDGIGDIRVWDVINGQLTSVSFIGHSDEVIWLTLSPDGTRLASASFDNSVKIWDVSSGKELFSLSGTMPSNVAFSPDSALFATIDNSSETVHIMDATFGKELLSFSLFKKGGFGDCYHELVFAKDNNHLYTSNSCTGTVYYWEIQNQSAEEIYLRDVSTTEAEVYLRITSDRSRLVVTSYYETEIWDTSTGEKILGIPIETPIWKTSVSPDGSLLAGVNIPNQGKSDQVKLWNLLPVGEVTAIPAHTSGAYIDFSPDGKYIATGNYADSAIKIWDITNLKEYLSIQSQNHCCSLAFDNTGKKFVTGAIDGKAKIWDSSTGLLQMELIGHTDTVKKAIFSPDNTRLATVSLDGTAKIWDAATGDELLSLEPGGVGESIAFSPDGNLLAVVSYEFKSNNYHYSILTIYNLNAPQKIYFRTVEDSATLVDIEFSPDGKQVAVADFNSNTAKVWNISVPHTVQSSAVALKGHTQAVVEVAFSPDSLNLFTASYDGTVKVWDVSFGVTRGKEITTLTAGRAGLFDVAISNDGKYSAVMSSDGILRVYYTRLEDLIAIAKTRVTRYLTDEECQKYLHGDCTYLPSDFKSINDFAVYVLSNSDDQNRVKVALDKIIAELMKDSSIKDPSAESRRILSETVRLQITAAADSGDIETTLNLFETARQSQIELPIDNADTLNNICWYGSLQGYAEQVLQYCETAVELAPDVAYIRDSRGLARALTGDLEGAIMDFQFQVDHPRGFESVIDKRKQWIEQLKQGINPITPEVLEALNSE